MKKERDHRRFLAPRDLWDVGTVEAWLEEKAAQGWILERWSTWAKFERMKPITCRVRLDPRRRDGAEQEEADALCQDLGWRPACTVGGDYQVYYCFDPTALDLYTDPESQAWAWEKLLRRTIRRTLLYILLIALWLFLQFDDLWMGSGRVVEKLLLGLWAVWLFAVCWAGGILWELIRHARGVARLKRRLAAGVPLEPGDPGRAVRRSRRYETVTWAGIVLLVGFLIFTMAGVREMPLSEAPEPLPYVSMEVLAPEAASLEMDQAEYSEFRGLLTDHREVDQFRWNFEASLYAVFDRVRVPLLAELLYRERKARLLDTWPGAEVREVRDARFDQAVVIEAGANRAFIGRLGRIVLAERVRTDRDLTDHLDDFAAVLAEFQ